MRTYRLGRRQPSVDRTRASILAAARDLLAGAPAGTLSVGAVATKAGVSRLTVYHRFGSRAGLLDALAPRLSAVAADLDIEPMDQLRLRFSDACFAWAADPALYRRLPTGAIPSDPEANHALGERLAAADRLRPGCSIREAQDVIGVLTAFETFDRLHQDGRRTAESVAEILMRLAGGILA